MADVDTALQSQIRNIESAYGKKLADWFGVIDQSGLTKHTEIVAMLKVTHGMTHGAAHRVSLLARDRGSARSPAGDPGEVVDGLYAGRKAVLRPLHDELLGMISALKDVTIAPKKGYLSLRRRKQFAMIQPSTTSRIDLGLIMPAGTPVTERLESAAAFNALFTHRVRITKSADIDGELADWLRVAHTAAR
jgi:hypothetical protein